MLKRIISILLCLVLMLSMLTACGKEQAMDVLDSVVEGADNLTQGIKDKMNAKANEALAQVREQADDRRRAILESTNEIVESDTFIKGETYTGTAYYVSNNGSDYNSGRSPESAFATAAPFEYISLYPGDAIFFERGSVWRGMEFPWRMCEVEGLTISAYGEGPKPAFYGSEENGSGAEKWELYHEDAEGRKIWKYYKDMTELGSIVLNGSQLVRRDIPWWDGNGYQTLDDEHISLLGERYDVTVHLPDMWCFPALDYTEPEPWNDANTVFSGWDDYGWVYRRAPLYFRCDAGNPGELYDDIEFIQPLTHIDTGAQHVYDNICIMYSDYAIISVQDGIQVQNCEFAWLGGVVNQYLGESELEDCIKYSYSPVQRSGEALNIHSSDALVKDNYIHNVFAKGIALDMFEGEEGMENNLICGNLIERNAKGIVLNNNDQSSQPGRMFKNILIEDNIVLDSGIDNFLLTEREVAHNSMAFQLEGGPCANENLFVRNNAFALSEGMLIAIYHYSEEYSKVFENNLYIQNEGNKKVFASHGIWIMNETGDFNHLLMEDKAVEYYFGDHSGEAYIIKH